MIWRAGAAVAATAPAALAVAADQGAKMAAPTVWEVLGYPFEAGSMMAALCACFAVRFYVGLSSGTHRWQLDIPVSALAIMFTAGAVIRLRPDPLVALFVGTAFGILGAGVIAIAKKYLDQVLNALGISSATPEQPKGPAQ